tara:strand:- start:229 stop:453 length:225 start_codon:yes stop_codon:yes gene_type:complete
MNLNHIQKYELEEWQENNPSIEDDIGNSYYICPDCGYDLSLILINDIDYVWCENYCFKKDFNKDPLLLFVDNLC